MVEQVGRGGGGSFDAFGQGVPVDRPDPAVADLVSLFAGRRQGLLNVGDSHRLPARPAPQRRDDLPETHPTLGVEFQPVATGVVPQGVGEHAAEFGGWFLHQ